MRRFVVFVVTKRRPNGWPIGVADDIETALAFIARCVREQAEDLSSPHDDCSWTLAEVKHIAPEGSA